METWELSAREQIREVMARYAHCADSGRFAELVELFDEKGILQIDGHEPLQGRAVILDFLGNTKTSLRTALERPYIRHHVSSLTIELQSPQQATAASYFLAITEGGPDHWGRYRDRLIRVGEVWLFQHRRVGLDGHSATSWRATRNE